MQTMETFLHKDEKGYLLPYTADGRKLLKCGISFNASTRNIEDWVVE